MFLIANLSSAPRPVRPREVLIMDKIHAGAFEVCHFLNPCLGAFIRGQDVYFDCPDAGEIAKDTF